MISQSTMNSNRNTSVYVVQIPLFLVSSNIFKICENIPIELLALLLVKPKCPFSFRLFIFLSFSECPVHHGSTNFPYEKILGERHAEVCNPEKLMKLLKES